MSGSNIGLLEDVRRIGTRHGLDMRAPLTKPFRADAIRQIVASTHIAGSVVPLVGLDEALAKGWLELWYQPKIDLRTRSLAGAEGLVRCRHPRHGVLAPASFLLGANESSHATLTEQVIATALRDFDDMAEAGMPLHAAVNTSIGALANLQLPALIREHRSKNPAWPGLILEVTESEVVKDVALMHEIATQLRIYGITLRSTILAKASRPLHGCATFRSRSSSSTAALSGTVARIGRTPASVRRSSIWHTISVRWRSPKAWNPPTICRPCNEWDATSGRAMSWRDRCRRKPCSRGCERARRSIKAALDAVAHHGNPE
jgi:hypothetical protein